jgi:hypothetical protein
VEDGSSSKESGRVGANGVTPIVADILRFGVVTMEKTSEQTYGRERDPALSSDMYDISKERREASEFGQSCQVFTQYVFASGSPSVRA